MFEECLPPQKRNGRPPFDKLAAILVTLLFHGLLGLLVYHGRFTIKIIPFEKEEIRSVVIVPPLKVSIPKIVGGHGLAELPGGLPEEQGPPGAERRPGEAAKRSEAGPEEKAGGPAGIPGAPSGGTVPPAGASSAIPSLSSRFQQSLAIHGKSELTIPLAPPGTPAGPPGMGGGTPMPDFSKYTRGVGGGGAGGYGTGRGRGGSGRQRVGMSIPLKGYDLLPWASKVIDRLQLCWNLPSVPYVPDPAKISMIVIIKKSGELDSIEILEGTTIEELDRAALEALRTALPFPALPADFPGDLLEITFEFVYND